MQTWEALHIVLYHYAGNNPVKYTDPDGRIVDTIWDIGFTLYDIGSAIYKSSKGDNSGWIDVAIDAAAILIPGVPAGLSKIDDAVRVARKADKIGDAVRVADKVNDGKKAIVLGENMARVKPATKGLQQQGVNAKWYQAWSKNFPKNGEKMSPTDFNKAIERNKKWLNSKLDDGYDVIDIGIDKARTNGRSPFYEAEQQILKERNYPVIKIEVD